MLGFPADVAAVSRRPAYRGPAPALTRAIAPVAEAGIPRAGDGAADAGVGAHPGDCSRLAHWEAWS
jgi:hypothetical protein